MFSYHPTTDELPLFESLYQTSQKKHYRINDFLSLSCLPDDAIKIVLNMSYDERINQQQLQLPCKNIGRQQFYTAVRLIQLYQNRVTVKNNLLKVADNIYLKPPSFMGISGTTPRKTKPEEDDEVTQQTELYIYDDKEKSDKGSIATNVLHYDNRSTTYKKLHHEIKKMKKELHTVEEKLEAEIKENFHLRFKKKGNNNPLSIRRELNTKKILDIRDKIYNKKSDDGSIIIEINKMLEDISETQNFPGPTNKFSKLQTKYKIEQTTPHQWHQNRIYYPGEKTKSSSSSKPISHYKYNQRERQKDATDELAEVILNDYKERRMFHHNLNASQNESHPILSQSQRRETVFCKKFTDSNDPPPLIEFLEPDGAKLPENMQLTIVEEHDLCDDISTITDPIYEKKKMKDKRRLLLVKTKSEPSMKTIKNRFF